MKTKQKTRQKQFAFVPLCEAPDWYFAVTGYSFPTPLQCLWLGKKPISAVGNN